MPDLSNITFGSMGTAGPLDNLSADGFTWAQCKSILQDKFGNYIISAQAEGGNKNLDFAWLNKSGGGWQASNLSQGFITRWAAAYDSIHDTLHALAECVDTNDGSLYRRYRITYSGNDIASIARDTDINLQLDNNSGYTLLGVPSLIFCEDIGSHGALVAVWCAMKTSDWVEVRASRRVLSNTSADNTAGNWTALDAGAGDTADLSISPNVDYTKIYSLANAGATSPAVLRLVVGGSEFPPGSLVLAFSDGNAARSWMFASQIFDGVDAWTSAGASDTLTAEKLSGTDTGYNLKFQIISQISEHSGGDWAVAFPVWKNNTDGDTWTWVRVSANDASFSSPHHVYSAGGAHSFAPDGDLMIDQDVVIVAYLEDTSLDGFLATYAFDGTPRDSAMQISAQDLDIPLLGSVRTDDNKLLIAARSNGSPPQQGYFGTADLASGIVVRRGRQWGNFESEHGITRW